MNEADNLIPSRAADDLLMACVVNDKTQNLVANLVSRISTRLASGRSENSQQAPLGAVAPAKPDSPLCPLAI